MESQDKPPDIPLAIPLCVCVPSPSQTPANVHCEMESGQRQAQEEVPAIAVDRATPIATQSPEAASPPFH